MVTKAPLARRCISWLVYPYLHYYVMLLTGPSTLIGQAVALWILLDNG